MIHTQLAGQNFEISSLNKLNEQIYESQVAELRYDKLAAYYGRDDVALYGLYNFFRHNSEEERELWEKLSNYVNSRGGEVALKTTESHDDKLDNSVQILEFALEVNKFINDKSIKLHHLAEDNTDPALRHFVKNKILQEYVESIKKRADFTTELKRTGGEGLGLYLFNLKLLKSEE